MWSRLTQVRRRRLVVALAILTTAMALVLVLLLNKSAGNNLSDSGLQKTANVVLPELDHPAGTLPIKDTSFQSFQAWFYDLRAPFFRSIKKVPRHQFIQVIVENPNTFPPQSPSLSTPGHPPVYIDAATMQDLNQSGKPRYASVEQNGSKFRIFVVPLKVPEILRSAGITGVLEVLENE